MEIIFFLAPCFLLVWALLVWRNVARNATNEGTPSRLTASQFDGLFAEQHAEESRQLAIAEARLRDEENRQLLLDRAAAGDETALDDAHRFGDATFYADTLQTLADQTNGDVQRLRVIVEYIVDSQELRSSREFAEMMIEALCAPVSQRSLPDLLHLAALADDPKVFERAVSSALKAWRDDLQTKVSSKDFLAIVQSAYWLASEDVRCSGSGFLFKQVITDVHRELAATNRWLA
ncbi:MAG: hypothetical protein ACKVZH_15175 [Blastocatellia bacterium]